MLRYIVTQYYAIIYQLVLLEVWTICIRLSEMSLVMYFELFLFCLLHISIHQLQSHMVTDREEYSTKNLQTLAINLQFTRVEQSCTLCQTYSYPHLVVDSIKNNNISLICILPIVQTP